MYKNIQINKNSNIQNQYTSTEISKFEFPEGFYISKYRQVYQSISHQLNCMIGNSDTLNYHR